MSDSMHYKDRELADLRRRIKELEIDTVTAKREAASLAMSLWRRHYKEDSPKIKLFDNLYLLITQIDNMAIGISNDLERTSVENVELRKDAGRYRFARDNIREDHELPGGYYLCDEGGQYWDNTIDDAMAHVSDKGKV